MKIALVHDDFMQSGGAENLFAEIAKIFPEAPIYTSLVDWNKLPSSIDPKRIKTSFIQKLAIAKKWYKLFLPLYPLAFESFNFNDFDIVISSTTRFAKGIITKPKTLHICYINSVPRFIWNQKTKKEYLPKILTIVFSPILKWLKNWDKIASSRVDHYIANSKNVAQKVKEHYGRDCEVIYPAVDTDFFDLPKRKNSSDFFLIVTRLVKWKKVEIAIKAAMDLGINLKIVGTGPDLQRLRSVVSGQLSDVDNIRFFGNVDRKSLRQFYQNAKALIVTQEEDFGISAVEAQACGLPVIAYNKGGVKEIITEDKTGLFFAEQSARSLQDAISRSSEVKWDNTACRNNALRFSQAEFARKLKLLVAKYAKFS